MKISADTFKNIDYKQFALQHTEKFVVALIGLVVVYVLWSTAWIPFRQTPEELTQIVDSTAQRVESSKWPAEERKKYGLTKDLQVRATKLFSPVEVSPYQYDTSIFWPLYPRQEPIREPEWLTAEDVLVSASYFVALVRRATEVAEAEPESTAEDTEPVNAFAKDFERKGSTVGAGRRPRRDDGFGRGGNIDEIRESFQQYQEKLQQEQASSGQSKSEYVGRGLRFVAVRAVFPLRRQLELLAKATSAANPAAVAELVSFQNFEIERQEAVAGPDPWSGKWEPVDFALAKQIINEEVAETEPEVVDIAVQSGVFTMPLPRRVLGSWGDEVSHPAIENYRLSDEEVEKQVVFNEALIARFKDEYEKEEQKVKRQGFAERQYDMTDIYRRALKNDQWEFGMNLLPKLAGMSVEQRAAQLREEIQKRVDASGKLLLLRYLDFGVEPGMIYRYRVRFSLFNPFRTAQPQMLADPSVAEGDTRVTEWSEPSPPVMVADDSQFYLVDVQEPRSQSLPSTQIDVFQWHPDAGTLVNTLMKPQAGAPIASQVKTEVLRPAEEKFEVETIEIDTGSLLVDANAAPSLQRELHADLGLTQQQLRDGLGLVEEALVLNRYGELKVIDTLSQRNAYDTARQMIAAQTEANADLRPVEEEEDDDRGRRSKREERRTKKEQTKKNPNRR